jgi:cytochrome c2
MRTGAHVFGLVLASIATLIPTSGCRSQADHADQAGDEAKPKPGAAERPDFRTEPSPVELSALIERGEEAYLEYGCDSCHALDQSASSRGPSFAGLFGSPARFTDQSEAVRDEAYLYESIVDPSAKVIDGWAASPMPITAMEREDAIAVVYYIRSLAAPDTDG